MKIAIVLSLCLLLTVILSLPVGLFLQWALPLDGPYALCLSIFTVPILFLARILPRRERASARHDPKPLVQLLATCLLAFFCLLQVFILVPPISRRIGPWAELRSRLVLKSQAVQEARVQLGIPAGRSLTPKEMDQIEQMVFAVPEEFVFPLVNRRVVLTMMWPRPPYVGIDYGGGRRAVFNLNSMIAIYTD